MENPIPSPVSISDLLVILPLLVLAGWGTLALVIDLFLQRTQSRLVGYFSLLGLLVSAIVGALQWNPGTAAELGFGGMVVRDSYSLGLGWIFLLIAALTIVMSLDYLPRQGIERGEFYPLVLFATSAMMLLAQSGDLIVVFLGIEFLSIVLYILTGFAYPRLTSEEAGMKYLLLGAFAAGFLVYGIALIYGQTGTTNLGEINEYLSRQTLAAQDLTLLYIGAALLIVAFGFKIALVPFHMWTPDVYEGSPTPVAAMMSAGTKGAGFAALLRVLLFALPTQAPVWVPALAALGATTMLIGNLGAIAQSNVKRMLAYSSIGHAGYILMGILAANERGTEGFLFYLLAYSLTNLGAFAVLIALEARGEAAWSMNDLAGLWQRRPLLAVVMAVFMLSLAGIPPTAGFWGKVYVFTAAWEAGLGWLALVGVLTSAIAVYFYLRIVVVMFMREPVREIQPFQDRGLLTGVTVAALGTIVFGLAPGLIISLVQQATLIGGS